MKEITVKIVLNNADEFKKLLDETEKLLKNLKSNIAAIQSFDIQCSAEK